MSLFDVILNPRVANVRSMIEDYRFSRNPIRGMWLDNSGLNFMDEVHDIMSVIGHLTLG